MMRPRSAAKPAQAIINLIMSSLYSPCRPYGQSSQHWAVQLQSRRPALKHADTKEHLPALPSARQPVRQNVLQSMLPLRDKRKI